MPAPTCLPDAHAVAAYPASYTRPHALAATVGLHMLPWLLHMLLSVFDD
jgi:hypothetical protein